MKFGKNLHILSVCLFLYLVSLSSQTPFLASKETSQEEYKFYSTLFGFGGGVGRSQPMPLKADLNSSLENSPQHLKSFDNLDTPSLSFLQSSVEIDKIYNPNMDFDPGLNIKDNMLLEKFGYGQTYNNLATKDTFKELVPIGSKNNTVAVVANHTPFIPSPSLKPSLNPIMLASNESSVSKVT